MMPDPVIDEIRRVRHEISRESGHDLRRMKETFAAIEAQFARPPVDRGGRRNTECDGGATSGQTATDNLHSSPADQ